MPKPALESVTVTGVVDASQPHALREARTVVAAMRRLLALGHETRHVALRPDGWFVLRGHLRVQDSKSAEHLLRRRLAPLLLRTAEVRWDADGVDKGFWIGAGAQAATLRAAIDTLARANALLARPCVTEATAGLHIALEPGEDPEAAAMLLAEVTTLMTSLQRAVGRKLADVRSDVGSDSLH